MKRKILLLVGLVTMLFLSSIAFAAKGEKKVNWKLGHSVNTDHIWHKTAVKFADLVEEKSNGDIKIKIYPNGQLGSETDMINSVRLGTLDMVLTGETLQNWAPKAALMAVPYAFRDLDHMKKVLNSDIGEEIKADIKEKVGLLPLYYHERAPRNLTSNKKFETVDDLKGLIIRVPEVPTFVKAWEVLGAKPTPMSLQEVFTALQQNTIQAQENPYDLIDNLGFYEVQKYAYETNHVIQWIFATVGEKQFNKLSENQRKIVLESAKEAQEYGEKEFKPFIKQAKQNLIDKGMTILELDREVMKNKVVPEMKNILSEDQYRLYKKIVETK